MTLENLLFIYSCGITVLLIFRSVEVRKYHKWYKLLLINPNCQFRVIRFFYELEPLFQRFYKQIDYLKEECGRPQTDGRFQFRWMIWWKFFGPPILQHAIREYNNSPFLHQVLKAPAKLYSREIFHYFRKKVSDELFQHWQDEILHDFQMHKLLNWTTAIIDSFPVKSVLNTQKCLKRPKIDYQVLKVVVETLNVSVVIQKLNISVKMRLKVETKLIALVIKNLWDCCSWQQCYELLYGDKAQNNAIHLPYHYKSVLSLQGVEKDLFERPDWQNLEQILVAQTLSVLQKLGFKAKFRNIRTITDLNGYWCLPHRWKDQDISFSYCAAKNLYLYGRGGLLVVLKELELPIMIALTPKYKQSEQSIMQFFHQFANRFQLFVQHIKILGDAEFGMNSIRDCINTLFNGNPIFPDHGKTISAIPISIEDRNDRKLVERVIARLHVLWHLETPSHCGMSYASFHLQLCLFCDLLQVYFNVHTNNNKHPHAILPIRG